MGLNNKMQAVFVAVGAGALALSASIAVQPIPDEYKIPIVAVCGAIGAVCFAVKEALGGTYEQPK